MLNDTRVFPARLYGQKEKTGAKIEVFLLRELNPELNLWDVLVDPARKIRVGNKLYFGDGELVAEVIDNTTSRGRTIRFIPEDSEKNFYDIIHEYGETPLPKEIKSIESSKKRKRLFIQIVLPLIVEENAKIRLDRKELFRILSKNINTQKEKNWLKEKFKQYGLRDGDFYSLKVRMDEIPVSLALAQAAKETGWGTSRFAQEGNALFGQWTWNGEGIRPAGVDKDAKHKVAKFAVLKASVRAYQRNLNTHSSYIEFRKERAIQRDNDEKLNSLKLVNYLDKYAETGQQYIDVLKQIIKQNSLTDFDDVNVMPTSNKTKKLI